MPDRVETVEIDRCIDWQPKMPFAFRVPNDQTHMPGFGQRTSFVHRALCHSRVEFPPRGCGRTTAKAEIPPMNGNEIKVFGRMAKLTARLADSARALSLCGSF
jgi:hypothetical protein